MTIPHSKAWYELQWALNRRDRLDFNNNVSVGQLVFLFNVSIYMWTPYWVVNENDGMYEVISAYGDERIKGVSVDKLGIAVNSDGKTYNETH